MFLDMLTADAASKHGHEFSDPQAGRWLANHRSPLRVLPYGGRPRLPPRGRVPRTGMEELREEPEDVDAAESSKISPYHDCSVEDLPIPGSFQRSSPPKSPILEAPLSEEGTASDALIPTTNLTIDCQEAYDEPPIVASTRRSRRPRTQYLLAHPPPSSVPLRKQGILRPRILFQLQQQTSARFYKPQYEVSPLTRFDPSKKIGQHLCRLGKSKYSIGADDLAVLKAADYSNANTTVDSLDGADSRDVIGIISPLPLEPGLPIGRANILLENSMWEATPVRGGIYELRCVGDEKQSARWYIPKSLRKKFDQKPDGDRKYYFASMIPGTKKHPTLACMTNANLDVYESYSLVPDAEVKLPPSQEEDLVIDDDDDDVSIQDLTTPDADLKESHAPIAVDELHRRLIVVSSFWVMFCEGWSPHFTFSSSVTRSSSPLPPNRSHSLPSEVGNTSEVISVYDDTPNLSEIYNSDSRKCFNSGKQPARSTTLEPPNSTSKRLSLPGFNRRASSTATSVRSNSVGPGSGTSSKAPSLRHDAEEIPLAERQRPERRIADPMLPFKHILDLNVSIPPTPSQSPVSRLDAIMRRKSATQPQPSVLNCEIGRRRSRSISWNWNLTLPRMSRPRPEQAGSPLSVAHEITNIQQLDGIAPDVSEGSIELSNRGDSTIIAGVTPPLLLNLSTGKSEALALTTSLPQSEAHDDSAKTPIEIQSDSIGGKYLVLGEGRGIQDIPEVDHLEAQQPDVVERPCSSESSDIEMHIVGMGSPYWREFDRIQTQHFVHRAEQLQEDFQLVGMSSRTALPEGDMVGQPVGKADVRPSIEGSGEALPMRQRAGWLTGLKRTVSKRRPRSYAGTGTL